MKVNKKHPTFPLHITKKNITSIIPLNLFQTWYTLDLPKNMKENVDLLKKQNPEFKHYLYDDAMCREFISQNFDDDVLYSFDKLKVELDKCILVCRNCHGELHGGLINI